MKYIHYYTFRAANDGVDGSTDTEQVFQAGNVSIYCKLMFDMDDTTDTYGHWIAVFDIVSDDVDIPERSIVLNPNTMHFIDDEYYNIIITSESDSISYYDLPVTYISIGVPEDE